MFTSTNPRVYTVYHMLYTPFTLYTFFEPFYISSPSRRVEIFQCALRTIKSWKRLSGNKTALCPFHDPTANYFFWQVKWFPEAIQHSQSDQNRSEALKPGHFLRSKSCIFANFLMVNFLFFYIYPHSHSRCDEKLFMAIPTIYSTLTLQPIGGGLYSVRPHPL